MRKYFNWLLGVETRYFIVYYIASVKEGQITGMIDFTSKPFLNKDQVLKIITEKSGGINPILTGFNELSKRELKFWEETNVK